MIHNLNQIHPTAYARKEILIFSDTIEANKLKEKIKTFLSELTEALKRSGCKLIGHIKGLVNAEDKGHLVFSITSFQEGARIKGEITGTVEKAVLTVNIIVFGIGTEIIETDYQKAFNKHFEHNGG